MLIDEFLPDFDFVEKHDISIRAHAADVVRAANSVDFGESWLLKSLFWLRGLPTENITLENMRESRFEKLAERPNSELLLGLVGKFWKPSGELKRIDSESFKNFSEAGFAKAVWNFAAEETGDRTILTTETRVKCLDDESRRSFGWYWTIIRPFSGLIRMEMLRLIKQRAELSEPPAVAGG
jgi:hypothetical protein